MADAPNPTEVEWAPWHARIERWLDRGCPEMTVPMEAARLAQAVGALLIDHKRRIASPTPSDQPEPSKES